ncbi:hypothetical protein HU830_00510 [Lactobacillus sp. DCY120]|uniref:Uncharacterized protein n=1 Tax=Bombilactobacillus apium TaxID=2675299 RepID=A0A850R0Z0_9LACO|nr:hypothetical protein [Bombilactobacillus apium]NVY95691.1 hypothetical protein [Bombilactobacillus apium]
MTTKPSPEGELYRRSNASESSDQDDRARRIQSRKWRWRLDEALIIVGVLIIATYLILFFV